jgi:hypothetical protein
MPDSFPMFRSLPGQSFRTLTLYPVWYAIHEFCRVNFGAFPRVGNIFIWTTSSAGALLVTHGITLRYPAEWSWYHQGCTECMVIKVGVRRGNGHMDREDKRVTQ